VTVNRPIKSLLETRPARHGEVIRVVHNSPDPRDLGDRPHRAPPGGVIRLVYHGTLTSLYGVDLAIRAVANARADGAGITFDVFGAGPARPSLEALIRKLGMSEAVNLRGSVAHAVLREVLPTFHAGLVPTRLDCMTRFSLSTKLLEVVHLQIPIIAPRLPTYLEYFPEYTAWYFEPNDAQSASDAIQRFMSASPGERAQRASAAAEAGASCAWRIDVRVLQDLYRGMLQHQVHAP